MGHGETGTLGQDPLKPAIASAYFPSRKRQHGEIIADTRHAGIDGQRGKKMLPALRPFLSWAKRFRQALMRHEIALCDRAHVKQWFTALPEPA